MLKIIFFLSINVLKFMFFFLLVNGILSLMRSIINHNTSPSYRKENSIFWFKIFFFNIREEKLGVQRNC